MNIQKVCGPHPSPSFQSGHPGCGGTPCNAARRLLWKTCFQGEALKGCLSDITKEHLIAIIHTKKQKKQNN